MMYAYQASPFQWRSQIQYTSPFDCICASFASHIWYGIVRHVRYAHHSARMAIAYVFQSFMARIISNSALDGESIHGGISWTR